VSASSDEGSDGEDKDAMTLAPSRRVVTGIQIDSRASLGS